MQCPKHVVCLLLFCLVLGMQLATAMQKVLFLLFRIKKKTFTLELIVIAIQNIQNKGWNSDKLLKMKIPTISTSSFTSFTQCCRCFVFFCFHIIKIIIKAHILTPIHCISFSGEKSAVFTFFKSSFTGADKLCYLFSMVPLYLLSYSLHQSIIVLLFSKSLAEKWRWMRIEKSRKTQNSAIIC